jgi:hypothetical protein
MIVINVFHFSMIQNNRALALKAAKAAKPVASVAVKCYS